MAGVGKQAVIFSGLTNGQLAYFECMESIVRKDCVLKLHQLSRMRARQKKKRPLGFTPGRAALRWLNLLVAQLRVGLQSREGNEHPVRHREKPATSRVETRLKKAVRSSTAVVGRGERAHPQGKASLPTKRSDPMSAGQGNKNGRWIPYTTARWEIGSARRAA